MDAVLASTIDLLEDVVKIPDSQSELAFTEPRHTEPLTGLPPIDCTWRLKERVKTASIALVLCLNVGVDPPDVVKIEPCSHLECWVDPLSGEPQKAIEHISLQLEKQYEQWSPRARYKKCLDPTVDEVKKLCHSLRRFSKQERVLFHYNGHGVPKPTQNGEIWVFNDKYTQYIPLNVYELQQWMSTPSIYVFDCSCAGSIVDSFLEFAKQHKFDYELELARYAAYQKIQQQNQPIIEYQSETSNLVDTKKNLHEPSEAIAASDKADPKSQPAVMENDTSSSTKPDQSTLELTIRDPPNKRPDYESCFQLAACEAYQILPMQPDLPADLFTTCLTTPIKMALRWFIQKNDSRFTPKISQDMLDKIPGSLSDRCTMLGELNWIFTSITDTIAWDVLPHDLFQRLYRQDLLVASLFRNFLLADRIMRTYECKPVSHPKLPKTYQHPMWRAWDMVVDLFLSQLVDVIEHRAKFKSSTFFTEQLTAFEVWLELDHSTNKKPDHQLLPIILQVLLSQIHRLRALDLLSRFLNLGPGAVNSALSVGIFPYVLKLLQSKGREVRPFLLSIWAKILAFDRRCQTDLVRDYNHLYFLTILSDNSYDAHYRTMAAFVMSCIVRDFRTGQELAYQASLIAHCLEQLDDPDPKLKKWLAICLGLSWDNFEEARWCGVRSCAHEKLYSLLDDPDPEVRAASVFALGTFINSISERTDHANNIDHSIGMKLVSTSLYDSSILVRRELVVALQYLVLAFESQFLKLEQIAREEERRLMDVVDTSGTLVGGTPPSVNSGKTNSHGFLSPTMQYNRSASKNHMRHHESTGQTQGQHHPPYYHQGINLFPISNFIPRVNSLNAIPVHYGPSSKIVSNVYHIIWRAMYTLAADPHPNVALIAQIIIDEIRSCSLNCMSTESLRESKSNSSISESSPPNTGGATFSLSESPPNSNATTTSSSNNASNLVPVLSLAANRSHQTGGRPHHCNPDSSSLANKPPSNHSNHHNNSNNYTNTRDNSSGQTSTVKSPPPTPPTPNIGVRANHVPHSASANIDRITKSANVTINNNHKSRRYASSRDNDMSEEDGRSNISSHKTLITTDFVDWSTRYFIEPENNYTSSCFNASNHHKSAGGMNNNNNSKSRQSMSKQDRQREWRMLKTLSYKNVCLKELEVVDPSRFGESSSNYKCQQVPNLLAVHSYDPIMIVASRDEFSVMHLEGPHLNRYRYPDSLVPGSANFLSSSSSSSLISVASHHISSASSSDNHHHHHHSHHNDLIGTQTNCHSNSSQITSLQLINPRYSTLVCTGSNDGSVRIWRAYDENDLSFSPQLIMACHLMPELLNTNNRSPIFHQASNCTIGSGGVLAGLATSLGHGVPISSGIAGLSLNHSNTGISTSIIGNGYHNNTSLTGNGQPTTISGTLVNSSNNINAHNLGMVLLWDQDQSNFYVTSDQNDVRIIRLWDAKSESKVQDIPTCAEFGVSCLSSDGEHSIAAGFLDGSIRIYDTRLKKTDCRTFTFRKHSEKILELHMFKPGEKHINLVSGDSGGEVRFWDKRAPTSVKRVDVGQKMNVMTVHPNADLFACGLRNGQGIKIYNLDGTSRPGCVIKTQESTFFTSRHNPSVNCLAFHPLRTSLVCGYSDSVVSVYSSRPLP